MNALSFSSTLLFLQLAVLGYSQNLVLNPSFELGATCDGTTERIEQVEHWTAISGQPSYINTQCPLSKDAKSFVLGMRLPNASHGQVHTVQKFDVQTECQQGTLSAPLEAGTSYVVSMWVRLPIQFCQTPIDEVGVVLRSTPYEPYEDRRVMPEQALALKTSSGKPISEQYGWEQVSALYVAKGGEQYIAIGNFGNTNIESLKNRPEKACTYLFIDAVAVRPFESIDLPTYAPSTVKVDQRLLLAGLEFEFKSIALSATSKTTLAALAEQLKANAAARVELSVYTHSNIDAHAGLSITEARAESIQAYLVEQGVSTDQFIVQGKGNTSPLVLDNDEAAQQKNERVEVIFTAI